MQVKSLSFRLLVSACFVLAAFFTLVSVVLEHGFRDSAEQALKEKLQVHVYSLLSAAELKNSGELIMPSNLPEPRFATPGSGLYGFIHLAKKKSKYGVRRRPLVLMCRLRRNQAPAPCFFC
jgi:hypothetical protein